MAEITYFQRYSTKENAVTNNTLQLFARIYEHSPRVFEDFLNELADIGDHYERLAVGPRLEQQVRSDSSVRDAEISQQSFRVLVETKIDAAPDRRQLRRHILGFKKEAVKVLLLVTKTPIDTTTLDSLREEFRKEPNSVVFNAIDFRRICQLAGGLFEPYERSIREIVEDYQAYCRHEGILDDSHEIMRIVPCGDSFELNKEYGIYYHPTERGYSAHAYVGIYARKRVRVLWKVRSVFDVTLEGRQIHKKHVRGEKTSDFDNDLRSIIERARSHCGHEIRDGHQFFCGEPLETDFRKRSKYGIQKNRYVNLRETLGTECDLESAKTVAAALRGHEWC